MTRPIRMAEPLLSLDALSVGFPGVMALRDVSFDIPRGKTVALVGESGCGKSLTARSLLRILPQEARITGGAMRLGALDIAALPERDPRLARIRGGAIGMIYQEPMTALSGFYTIGNQIEETVIQHGASRTEARARALEMLRAVGMPDPERRIDAYSFELSGGQRQRAMIAMALSTAPQLLIADEPTTALDVTTQAVILDLLRRLQAERGMSMLFITHDLGVVAQIADEAVVMYLGEVVEKGPVRDILRNPQHPYTQALIASVPDGRHGRLAAIGGTVPRLDERPEGCAFAPRCASAVALCRVGRVPLAQTPAGTQARCLAYPDGMVMLRAPERGPDRGQTRPGGDPVLSVRGLSKSFRSARGMFARPRFAHAVADVDLDLRAGETLALVGESGCGKTTLGRAILGLHAPSAGSVTLRLDGEVELTTLDPAGMRQVWRDLRMVFQDPVSSLNARMTVFDIVADPLRRSGARDVTARVYDALAHVGLDPELANRYPHAFSGGQRQRIGIARALVTEPRIVVLDEPVSALDVSVQAQVLNLLGDLQARLGLAYLFISHDLNVVASVAHRVAVMYAGRIVEEAPADTLFGAPRHPYTRALLSARLSIDPDAPRAPLPPAGGAPDPADLPQGCAFAPRCPLADAGCATRPGLQGGAHRVACHKTESLHASAS